MIAKVKERNNSKQIAIYHNSADYCTISELFIDCNESVDEETSKSVGERRL